MHIYKLLIEFRCHTVEELSNLSTSIKNSKNYSKVIRFGNDTQSSALENVEKAIQENITNIAMEKTEKERLEEEKRLRWLNSDEDIDLESETYYDFLCPYCGYQLSFMSWQADENSNVFCPVCDNKFKVTFSK